MNARRYTAYQQDSKFPLIFSIVFHGFLFLAVGLFFKMPEVTVSQITVDLTQEIDPQSPSEATSPQSVEEPVTQSTKKLISPSSPTSQPSLREQMQQKFRQRQKQTVDDPVVSGSRRGVKNPSREINPSVKQNPIKSDPVTRRQRDFIKGLKSGSKTRDISQREISSNNDNRVNNTYGRNSQSPNSARKNPSQKTRKKGKVSRNNNVQFKFKNNKRRQLLRENKIFIPRRIRQSGVATKIIYSFAIKSNGFVYDIKKIKGSGLEDLDLIVRRYIQNLKFNRLRGDVSSYRTTLTYDFSVKSK